MQVGEGVGEPGPAVHVGQQAGDAQVGRRRVEPVGQLLGRLGRDRLQGRDRQLAVLDPDVFERARCGFAVDLRQAPIQQRAAFGEVLLRGRGHGDGQRPGVAHSGEQGGRDELVLDGAPLPAALDPDVARAQPVAQGEQGGGLPGASVLHGADVAHAHDGVAPGRSQERGGQALRPSPAVVVCAAQQFDRAQRRGRGGHGAQPERAEEQRAEPVQHGPGTRGEGGQVHLVGARQALGFGDTGSQLVPADRGRHRPVQVRAALLGLDQRGAQLGEQAHLVVHRTGVAQHRGLLARLGAAEHAADRAVEQRHAVIGQPRDGVEHRGDQRRAAPQWREQAEVLGRVARTLARQLAQPLRVDALGAGRIEADRAQAGELLDDALERLVTGCTRRLARPRQHAHRRALLGHE